VDVPTDSTTRLRSPLPGRLRSAVAAASSAPRRRPTGEPPPLPHRLQTSGIGWLTAAIVVALVTAVVFGPGLQGPAVAVTVADDAIVRWLGGLAPVGLFRAFAAIASWWVLNALGLTLIVALLVLKRIRHLIIGLVTANVVSVIILTVLGAIAQRPRPFGVPIRVGWGGWGMPSMQVAVLSTVLLIALYTLLPEGRWRNRGKFVMAALVALAAIGRIALGADAPTDVLVGVVLGVALPLLAFRLLAPNSVFPIRYRRGRSAHLDIGGARGAAIRKALTDQLGLEIADIKPFGLSGSAGSTPIRITLAGDPPTYLFGKLYARSHLRADRWYKLGRELMYGRLEDEKPFNSVRRLVQQEDYALRVMRDAGLPSPAPFGFVELTPDREYMLVAEFFDGAVELGDAELNDPDEADQIIDDGLEIVRRLWDAGLAHRDIKPANLMVRDGRLLMIDVFFAEMRPTPWRQAVDLANMMLCLALRTDVRTVYERSLQKFTVEEITEGFAAARGLALPSQLRRMMRDKGRDLHAEFSKLLPVPPRPIRIQRWSLHRVGLWVAAGLLALLLVSNIIVSLNNEIAVDTSIKVSTLACDDLEPLWLEAQSVPTAAMVPCVRNDIRGWSVGRVAVNSGRSVIKLDHDRAGPSAVVATLAAACDPAGATAMNAPEPGVERLMVNESRPGTYFQARLYDRFPGGCVTYDLRSATDTMGAFTDDLPQLLGMTSRESLAEALATRSDGRLRLDP